MPGIAVPLNFRLKVRTPDAITWQWDTPPSSKYAFIKVYDSGGNSVSGNLAKNATEFPESCDPNTYYERYARCLSPEPDFYESPASNTTGYYTLFARPDLEFYAVHPASITVQNQFELIHLSSSQSGSYFMNAVNVTDSGWIRQSSWTSTGLSANTFYTFSARLRNGDAIETLESVNLSTYTHAASPAAPELVMQDTSFMLLFAADENPASTRYSIKVSTEAEGGMENYLQLGMANTLVPEATYYTKTELLSDTPDGDRSFTYDDVFRMDQRAKHRGDRH